MVDCDLSLVNRETGLVVVRRLELADTFWSRLRGLQFRRSFAQGSGLLLVPCSAIHTFWMRFPVDIAMLDRRGRVLRSIRSIAPNRVILGPRGTHAVLELPADESAVSEGDRLRIVSREGVEVPACLER